ncbi:CBS domain-containing protein [Kitasatospora sp. MAP12-15]|nr:CBS domain-containing protein [Kitasatospora sp. MAP12-44]
MKHPHTVGDVMTHAVIAVGRDAPFQEIVENLRQWRISALPVLAGDGRVVGVVSEADLLARSVPGVVDVQTLISIGPAPGTDSDAAAATRSSGAVR